MTTRNEQTSGFQTADFSKSEDPSLLSSFPVEVIAGAGGATGMAASAGSPNRWPWTIAGQFNTDAKTCTGDYCPDRTSRG